MRSKGDTNPEKVDPATHLADPWGTHGSQRVPDIVFRSISVSKVDAEIVTF